MYLLFFNKLETDLYKVHTKISLVLMPGNCSINYGRIPVLDGKYHITVILQDVLCNCFSVSQTPYSDQCIFTVNVSKFQTEITQKTFLQNTTYTLVTETAIERKFTDSDDCYTWKGSYN